VTVERFTNYLFCFSAFARAESSPVATTAEQLSEKICA
jgi:hypothetical protein